MTDSASEPVAHEPVYVVDSLIAEDIDSYLDQHQHKTMLRFITCGSVDDGKSTLIGRLLYDSKMIFEDQLDALTADSKKSGTQGAEIDFALLVDGLAAERELHQRIRWRDVGAGALHHRHVDTVLDQRGADVVGAVVVPSTTTFLPL